MYMRTHRWARTMTRASVVLLLLGSVGAAGPRPAVAQVVTCTIPAQPASTSTASTSQSTVQGPTLTAQQKQALCQAAEHLERHSLALTADLASALVPGTLGPTGPLALADVLAHTASPSAGTTFDLTVGATTSGLAESLLISAGLVGYLRALTHDATDSNFTAVAQPVPPPFVFPGPGRETNLPVATTFQDLLINESQALGVSQTLLLSLRRARAAASAGNTTFQTQQRNAAALSAAQLATLLSREAQLRLNVQGALQTEGLPVVMGDPALVAALQGAAQLLAQFAATQGAALPVPPPPLPPAVPVVLPPPPSPPPSPPPAEGT